MALLLQNEIIMAAANGRQNEVQALIKTEVNINAVDKVWKRLRFCGLASFSSVWRHCFTEWVDSANARECERTHHRGANTTGYQSPRRHAELGTELPTSFFRLAPNTTVLRVYRTALRH
jgi:hypothetical protein